MTRKPVRNSSIEYIFQTRHGEVAIPCTNTDRVMFPADGITKGELIAYYHKVADVMVPELAERPISVERFTKGIDAGGFFQKHAQKHFPAWIERVELGTKTRVEYPLVNDTASLIYLANQGSIVFHIWTSRREAPEYPDLLVFDLDPPEGKFEIVRTTALRLRDLFEEIGLRAFVKTTGGKGLHVVAPLDGRAAYAEVLALCTKIARHLVAKYPDELTIEFYKKDRKGRLFLDVMRNALGATLVAAYSVRPRPGAPVSAPIAWAEVEDPHLRPNSFTLRDVPGRIATQGDPWARLRDEPGSIDDADAALDRLTS
ncbi:MAG: non-homologous end-joining DNA ligase [Deltaproteobacteria bacterium]|nr:non-homologous end-joining DNA ligase [Deltaproteobacteria bacterium]MCW5802969.1 non-homologous end-joining DNA ligase [Deltaproteobacteria bacterium]